MIHYHGTPISPNVVMDELAGRCFCVSYARPDGIKRAHAIGQSVMLDNGAFSFWRRSRSAGSDKRRSAVADWPGFYRWADKWLDYPTTWAVIPDVIDGDEADNDRLIAEWAGTRLPRGAPVWHMHEPMERLARLCAEHERVCIGSSGQYAQLRSPSWHARMAEAMEAVSHGRMPWLHMLRGMALSGSEYPFASVDSTDVARNHHRPQNTAGAMAARWDAIQNPPRWGAV